MTTKFTLLRTPKLSEPPHKSQYCL